MTRQVLGVQAYDGDAPSLDGNLAGVPRSAVEAVVIRGFALVSSVVAGLLVGAGVGAVGWLLARVLPVPCSHRTS